MQGTRGRTEAPRAALVILAAMALFGRTGLAQTVTSPPVAQPVAAVERTSTEELAKQSQNPIAFLLSSFFQNDINFEFGPDHRTQDVLYLLPVYPVSLGSKLSLITRTVVPMIWQPNLAPATGTHFGLGDILFSAYFSPKLRGNLTVGVGPAVVLPTGTVSGPFAQNGGQWCIGPAGAITYSPGRLVFGLLLNNIFSFNGRDNAPSVDTLALQPFFNVILPRAFFLTTSPLITADWEQPNDQRWLVPVGGGFGAVFKIGSLPFNANAQAYWNAVRPDGAALWTLRLTVATLFPSKN
jgi:hypothetical protein